MELCMGAPSSAHTHSPLPSSSSKLMSPQISWVLNQKLPHLALEGRMT